ncbi:MAG: GAF domain-containing sensor histidine kinase [Propionibacteriaceae bacterium]
MPVVADDPGSHELVERVGSTADSARREGLAEDHEALRQLVDQQTALRQVIELAARDAPTEEVLQAVAVQASHLADVDFTAINRYGPDGSTEVMALSGASQLVVGTRHLDKRDGVTRRVWQTRKFARIDDLTSIPSTWAQVARSLGYTTSAAVPIMIRGELWGTLVVVGRGEPLTNAIEDSLTSFAALAGTAISHAQARQDLRALADEQAAFRRVAELVARGTALELVFDALTDEASKLLGGLPTALQRADPDGSTPTVSAHEPMGARSNQLTTEVAVPVTVEGRRWGVLMTRSAGSGPSGVTEQRLRQFAELAAAAIANAENKAKLTASRSRVLATADEARRRLQRDVHDGAQQRLVHTIITLKLALGAVDPGSTAAARIAEALHHAQLASQELRDLVHGILPAALTHGGLRIGLESLISDIGMPVQLQLTAPPLPADIETTAYFVVAEALTNVVKHARATRADVNVDFDGATVTIEVTDDGVGGADPGTGSGLTGLADRVEALDGSLHVISAVTAGTTVRASFPFAAPPR